MISLRNLRTLNSRACERYEQQECVLQQSYNGHTLTSYRRGENSNFSLNLNREYQVKKTLLVIGILFLYQINNVNVHSKNKEQPSHIQFIALLHQLISIILTSTLHNT